MNGSTKSYIGGKHSPGLSALCSCCCCSDRRLQQQLLQILPDVSVDSVSNWLSIHQTGSILLSDDSARADWFVSHTDSPSWNLPVGLAAGWGLIAACLNPITVLVTRIVERLAEVHDQPFLAGRFSCGAVDKSTLTGIPSCCGGEIKLNCECKKVQIPS